MTNNDNSPDVDESISRTLYDRPLSVIPGGVNSSVRAIRPYPFSIDRGEGANVVDADGNRYIDYVQGYGPLLLGHDLPETVRAAVESVVSDGPMYGAPTEAEVELAEFIVEHVPNIEMVRFVNSGTEATMSVVRLARGYTDRKKIVIMQGGYHGAQESALVEGDPERPRPSSAGVPQTFAEHTIPVPFNDERVLHHVFEEQGDEIAGMLVEPIIANQGIVTPVDGYLDTLRSVCDDHGTLLIFDEVITGFRVVGLQYAQGAYDIEPDLTTFAKIIGGGFPVGAIAGATEIMEQFTPSGDVFQSGTFSDHPVTMAAGLGTLRFAAKNDVYDHVNRLGEKLRTGLTEIVADHAPEYTVVGRDSLFKLVFTRDGDYDGSTANSSQDSICESGCQQRAACPRFDTYPKTGADVKHADMERWERLFWPAVKDQGVFLTPNQFEPQFVSYVHTGEDIEQTLEAYKHAL
jgi:glutamate-1-semialdehyde 2,1-aminomutase